MDMYDSEGGDEQAQPQPESAQPKEEGKEEQGNTITFNKDACPDAKPGDMLMVKVLKVMDDDIMGTVEKQDEEHDEEQGPTEEAPPEQPEQPQGDAGGGMY